MGMTAEKLRASDELTDEEHLEQGQNHGTLKTRDED